MSKGNGIKKFSNNFSDFLSDVIVEKMRIFILNGSFKKKFNEDMKKMIKEMKGSEKEKIDLIIMFNTDGNIAIIDESIIAKIIYNDYENLMRLYYRISSLNKLIKNLLMGDKIIKESFIKVSYKVFYNSLIKIYSELKCRKDIIVKYRLKYNLVNYNKEDISIIVLIILILEEICFQFNLDYITIEKIINSMINVKTNNDY
ncbi:hypothetical protein FDF74_05700 [Clostridium niameyense]|uniref:Uncharacterized protein n=1 Tax=Clostridium niameyense TaxID=1622073 RepID=A0A6M0RAU5_9CLOT|nr:hypothetical protein [Clostridium niameyense]NEZ46709.1 hypothetical protein [Clostridium niameyense]